MENIKDITSDILAENTRRNDIINAPFNPVTGEGSIGERKLFAVEGMPIPRQWIPSEMFGNKFVKALAKYKTIDRFLKNTLKEKPNDDDRLKVIDAFVRLRSMHDFPFWAKVFVKIKNKGGGEDVTFHLSRPQRKLVQKLEDMRRDNKPIRLILLKARQWGGSTCIQIYMAWLQLVHKVGLNSLIIAHQGTGSDEIKDMFDRLLDNYPIDMLYPLDYTFKHDAPKTKNIGKSGSIQAVPQRKCKIKIGTAERPDSCRGGDYNLVHLSEVGVWRKTDGKSPEEIVGSACTGVQLRPYTMIVYESTAKGSDNFFHKEYLAAKNGNSQFKHLFIAWYEIEWNSLAFDSAEEREHFAANLYRNRLNDEVRTMREESGKYLWWLWNTCGASLEAIHWYASERAGKPSHEIMASECPSDDVEAFVFSGANVFDRYKIDELRSTCKPPKHIGEISADEPSGENALRHIHFTQDTQGRFHVWEKPEIDPDEIVTDRYLVVVDVGKGRTNKADNSVICVIDRIDIADCGRPRIVAEWVGHIDMDLLAWKAAQVAAWYDNALLVIESNTLETASQNGIGTNHFDFILYKIRDHYENLYARPQSPDDIKENAPLKYGFHTNTHTKPVIIDGLIEAVRDKLWVERSEQCLAEFVTYVRTDRGGYEAPSGSHDDRLMTRAIGLHISTKMPVPQFLPRPKAARQRPQRRSTTEATF